ncbi:MAG: hypothetical protein AB1758_22880 [Candidatus Eremiobacterota bacterium]
MPRSKIHPDGNSREPDLLFVRTENLSRLTADRLEARLTWS